MLSNQTKPKPPPRTVEEWKEARRRRYASAGDGGGFRILPRKVLDSDAYNELSNSGKLILILSLDQLDYWQKKHKGQECRETSVGRLRNDGRFSLPNNLLKDRGIRSSHTVSRARKELVAAGFWETIEAGTLYQSGIFRWSDDWLKYNQKPIRTRKLLDDSVQAPGFCHYPNIITYNQLKQAADGTAPSSDALAVQLGDSVTVAQPVQLSLFADGLSEENNTDESCLVAKALSLVP